MHASVGGACNMYSKPIPPPAMHARVSGAYCLYSKPNPPPAMHATFSGACFLCWKPISAQVILRHPAHPTMKCPVYLFNKSNPRLVFDRIAYLHISPSWYMISSVRRRPCVLYLASDVQCRQCNGDPALDVQRRQCIGDLASCSQYCPCIGRLVSRGWHHPCIGHVSLRDKTNAQILNEISAMRIKRLFGICITFCCKSVDIFVFEW